MDGKNDCFLVVCSRSMSKVLIRALGFERVLHFGVSLAAVLIYHSLMACVGFQSPSLNLLYMRVPTPKPPSPPPPSKKEEDAKDQALRFLSFKSYLLNLERLGILRQT